jgi:hypothetical protein
MIHGSKKGHQEVWQAILQMLRSGKTRVAHKLASIATDNLPDSNGYLSLLFDNPEYATVVFVFDQNTSRERRIFCPKEILMGLQYFQNSKELHFRSAHQISLVLPVFSGGLKVEQDSILGATATPNLSPSSKIDEEAQNPENTESAPDDDDTATEADSDADYMNEDDTSIPDQRGNGKAIQIPVTEFW